jgi:hypothetical protein
MGLGAMGGISSKLPSEQEHSLGRQKKVSVASLPASIILPGSVEQLQLESPPAAEQAFLAEVKEPVMVCSSSSEAG